MPFKDSLCIVDSPYLLQPQQMIKWIVPMRSIWEGRRLVLLSFFCALCVTFQRERDSHQWWSRYCCRVHCAAAPTLIASWRLRPVSVIAVCAYNCLYPHITNSFLYSPVLPLSLSLSLSLHWFIWYAAQYSPRLECYAKQNNKQAVAAFSQATMLCCRWLVSWTRVQVFLKLMLY